MVLGIVTSLSNFRTFSSIPKETSYLLAVILSSVLCFPQFMTTYDLRSVSVVDAQSLSCVLLFATPWTVTRQAPLSVGFSTQEYWSELPFPSPGELPNPEMEPVSSALQADTLPLSHWEASDLLLLLNCSVMSDSLRPHGQQHPRLPCPSPSPGVCSNSCPLSQRYHLYLWICLL